MLRRWRPSWAQIHINYTRERQRKSKSKSSLYDYCYGLVSQYTVFDILLLLFRKPLRFFVVLNQQLVLRKCIILTFFFLPFFFSFLFFPFSHSFFGDQNKNHKESSAIKVQSNLIKTTHLAKTRYFDGQLIMMIKDF